MPVQSVVFKSIEARRFQERPEGPVQLRVDHNSHLGQVGLEGDRLRVEFTFTTSYGAMGVIKMDGVLLLQTADAAAAVKAFTETRNLPPDVAQEVHTGILQAGVPEAVGLSRMVRLPPPIPLPQVRINQGDAQAQSQAPVDSPEIG